MKQKTEVIRLSELAQMHRDLCVGRRSTLHILQALDRLEYIIDERLQGLDVD